MNRITAVSALSALLIASGLSGVATAAEPSPALSCPAALDPAYKPPAGARLTGAAVNGSKLLTHASMATGAPADQDAGILPEFEQDDERTKDGITTYTYYYETTKQSPLSVICGYGELHGAKQSVLLLPVPSGTKGDCKFRTPAAAAGDKSGTLSTMVCSWH